MRTGSTSVGCVGAHYDSLYNVSIRPLQQSTSKRRRYVYLATPNSLMVATTTMLINMQPYIFVERYCDYSERA